MSKRNNLKLIRDHPFLHEPLLHLRRCIIKTSLVREVVRWGCDGLVKFGFKHDIALLHIFA
ncbi:hypothetical protein V1478_013420 [Vespula squamosa]|uniref:Uncharacterized protein n=1 Tax=Vespula squamosa TaxID=30214 RepID=A0ABD2AAX6_VESSQ